MPRVPKESKETEENDNADISVTEHLNVPLNTERNEEFYLSINKKIVKTADELKFDYEISNSQYHLYFNAIILVSTISMMITAYIVAGSTSFDTSNYGSIACLISTSACILIGMIWCTYDSHWKTKIDPNLKVYKIPLDEELTDEKRKFIHLRGMFISLSQIQSEKTLAANYFRKCTFLFALGFLFFIMNSLMSIPLSLIIIALYLLPISSVAYNKITGKSMKMRIEEIKDESYDLIRNLFFEKDFKTFAEAFTFLYFISRKKKCDEYKMDQLAKGFRKFTEDDT